MHHFNIDDTVRFEGQGKVHYGLVKNVGKRFAVVYDLDTCEEKKIALSRLTYIAPVTLDPEQLGRLCRYEVSWTELTGGAPDHANISFTGPFTITLGDIREGLKNINRSNADNNTLANEWFNPIYSHYCIYLNLFLEEKTPSEIEIIPGLPDRAAKLSGIFSIIESIFQKNVLLRYAANGIIRDIDRYLEDENKPAAERRYTDPEKENFIAYYDCVNGEGDLRTADEQTRSLFRSFVNELCAKDNKLAMRIKGRCSVNGNDIFAKEPAEAFKCLNKLFIMTCDPQYVFDLGELYFTGACMGGTPDYEKAFRNYSIAASSGIIEARRRIAIMFAEGKGVPMNKDVAWKITEEVYSDCEHRFLMGDHNCRFAEAAYSKGVTIMRGIAGYSSPDAAYRFLLQAKLALKLRSHSACRTDDELAEKIKSSIEELLTAMPPRNKSAQVWINSLLQHHLHKYRRMIMRIRRLKGGELKLTFSIEKFSDENSRPLMLITETKTGFCDLVGTFSVKVIGSDLKMIPEDPIYFNATDGHNYYLGGSKVITVNGNYTFSPKA